MTTAGSSDLDEGENDEIASISKHDETRDDTPEEDFDFNIMVVCLLGCFGSKGFREKTCTVLGFENRERKMCRRLPILGREIENITPSVQRSFRIPRDTTAMIGPDGLACFGAVVAHKQPRSVVYSPGHGKSRKKGPESLRSEN